MRTLQSFSTDEASATARLLEMEVLPTPLARRAVNDVVFDLQDLMANKSLLTYPLPPTKTTGVSPLGVVIWDSISAIRGLSEHS